MDITIKKTINMFPHQRLC